MTANLSTPILVCLVVVALVGAQLEPVARALVGRRCEISLSDQILRPIVSAWLPIVQGEVTFPCIVLGRHPADELGDWQIGLLRDVKYLSSWKYWQPANPPEQISPGEKAWVEYCREQGIQWPDSRAQAVVKFTFLAGRASVEGDNERK